MNTNLLKNVLGLKKQTTKRDLVTKTTLFSLTSIAAIILATYAKSAYAQDHSHVLASNSEHLPDFNAPAPDDVSQTVVDQDANANVTENNLNLLPQENDTPQAPEESNNAPNTNTDMDATASDAAASEAALQTAAPASDVAAAGGGDAAEAGSSGGGMGSLLLMAGGVAATGGSALLGGHHNSSSTASSATTTPTTTPTTTSAPINGLTPGVISVDFSIDQSSLSTSQIISGGTQDAQLVIDRSGTDLTSPSTVDLALSSNAVLVSITGGTDTGSMTTLKFNSSDGLYHTTITFDSDSDPTATLDNLILSISAPAGTPQDDFKATISPIDLSDTVGTMGLTSIDESISSPPLNGGSKKGPPHSPPPPNIEINQGSVVITEIMLKQNGDVETMLGGPSVTSGANNPAPTDNWFEVYNPTAKDINLNGMQIVAGGQSAITINSSTILKAGTYAVISTLPDAEITDAQGTQIQNIYVPGLQVTTAGDLIIQNSDTSHTLINHVLLNSDPHTPMSPTFEDLTTNVNTPTDAAPSSYDIQDQLYNGDMHISALQLASAAYDNHLDTNNNDATFWETALNHANFDPTDNVYATANGITLYGTPGAPVLNHAVSVDSLNAADHSLIISEFMANPNPLGDPGDTSTGQPVQWFEIQNNTMTNSAGVDVDLKGLTITTTDSAGTTSSFTITSDLFLKVGSALEIGNGEFTNNYYGNSTQYSDKFQLDTTSGSIAISNSSGDTLDTVNYDTFGAPMGAKPVAHSNNFMAPNAPPLGQSAYWDGSSWHLTSRVDNSPNGYDAAGDLGSPGSDNSLNHPL